MEDLASILNAGRIIYFRSNGIIYSVSKKHDDHCVLSSWNNNSKAWFGENITFKTALSVVSTDYTYDLAQVGSWLAETG